VPLGGIPRNSNKVYTTISSLVSNSGALVSRGNSRFKYIVLDIKVTTNGSIRWG